MTDNGKLMAVGVLSLAAVVLLCTLLILTHLPAQPAYGVGPLDRQGDYVMLPGDTIQGNRQLVFVIDLAAQKCAAYAADLSGRRIDVMGTFDLTKLPQPTPPPGPLGRGR